MQTIRTLNGLYLAENTPSQNKRCRAQRGNGGKSTALVQGTIAQRFDGAHIIRYCQGTSSHTTGFLGKETDYPALICAELCCFPKGPASQPTAS